MTLGMILLWGPRGRLFLMSEVPLYPDPHTLNPQPCTHQVNVHWRSQALPELAQPQTAWGVSRSVTREEEDHTLISENEF
ncbi:hypothetical protein T484DRAFT_2752200 [Baffinella frigidus]|nr:hypothetical protein T484DRAFT_2752200 [Cryptophyta sp. CCMP2293]